MEGKMKTYTIALATRLKRKVFLAGNIPADVERLSREALNEEGIDIKETLFYDYGYVCCVNAPESIKPEAIAYTIRKSTSRPIREMYPELWAMPSLWNSKAYIEDGELTEAKKKNIEGYYQTLKSR